MLTKHRYGTTQVWILDGPQYGKHRINLNIHATRDSDSKFGCLENGEYAEFQLTPKHAFKLGCQLLALATRLQEDK